MMNLIGGARHTSNDLAFQECIMMPVGAPSFSEALRMASETHMALQDIVVARYGKLSANTGDEGDFATPIVDARSARSRARGVAAPLRDDVVYALDCAATHPGRELADDEWPQVHDRGYDEPTASCATSAWPASILPRGGLRAVWH
jgi:enolase